MKVLVYGNGWLGNALADYFEGSVSKADILDSERVASELCDVRPEVVINAAGKCGKPNIDWCIASEENRRLTRYVNTFGPAILYHTVDAIGAYLKRNFQFVHLSSGCLWENAEDVDEQTKADPPSWYSKTKAEGEQRLPGQSCLIIRARMPVSAEPHPRNLITKLATYDHVLDVQNSVTFVDDLCVAVEKLVRKNARGVYNVVNPGSLSAWDIMGLYCEFVDDMHCCAMSSMKELEEMGFIQDGRSNCTLNTDKLKAQGIELPSAKEKIREVMRLYGETVKARRQETPEEGD